ELVGEFSGANVRQAGYAWGIGPVARLDSSGAPASYYAADARGDVLALTDSSGAVTDRYRYLPFGEVADHSGATVQPLQFQGAWGLRADKNGLVDARTRVYDPAMGRFLSDDPVLFASANPATYASNDPINRVDVDGREDAPTSASWSYWSSPEKYLGFDRDGT